MKENYELAQTDQGAEEVYQLIKDRMLAFTETLTEKQTRVQSEFRFIEKGFSLSSVASKGAVSKIAEVGKKVAGAASALGVAKALGSKISFVPFNSAWASSVVGQSKGELAFNQG